MRGPDGDPVLLSMLSTASLSDLEGTGQGRGCEQIGAVNGGVASLQPGLGDELSRFAS